MTKPTIDQLKQLDEDVDLQLSQQHIDRLADAYFQKFSPQEVVEHLRLLSKLSKSEPVQILADQRPNGVVAITVLAVDYPAAFSLIAGVLAGMQFSIESGDIFTYNSPANTPDSSGSSSTLLSTSASQHRRHREALRRAMRSRRRLVTDARDDRPRIIDHFVGKIESTQSFDVWEAQLTQTLKHVMGELSTATEQSVANAKRFVNELVTRQLARSDFSNEALLWPVQLDIKPDIDKITQINVVGQDTPAFLYTLTTALELHKLAIQHIRIRTHEQRVEDVIHVTDSRGRPITDAALIEKIKLSILLTKQFIYFLTLAPAPYTALSRFEHLTENITHAENADQWLDLLANPLAMQDLARLLGASDYLWEDFIRQRYDQLLNLLQPRPEGRRICAPVETLSARLESTLAGAESFEQKRKVLNEFKNREIFLYDLDHILTRGSHFQLLSKRLSALAETVVGAAAGFVWDRLTEKYGQPHGHGNELIAWAVFGLGKLGGKALGYASDIELLFVYSDLGKTDGKNPINNTEFFEKFVVETADSIVAKHEGIFEVDLRLRPYGKDGPNAVSADSFNQYFSADGPAHPMERLALIRLRPLAGDPDLARHIQSLRDQFVYHIPLDLDRMHEIRVQQYEEKDAAKNLNAKYSCGTLLDLESNVQMLQARHGADVSQARTYSIQKALNALADAEIISTTERDAVTASYHFFRKLINGLRMLRGNAKDLDMPPRDSIEYQRLARRINYIANQNHDAAEQMQLDLDEATAVVRGFVDRHFTRDFLPDATAANPADLVLMNRVDENLARIALSPLGIQNPSQANQTLLKFAECIGRRRFAKLLLRALPALRNTPDPDLTLANWFTAVSQISRPKTFADAMLEYPQALEISLKLLGRNDAITSLLLAAPELPEWLTNPHQLLEPKNILTLNSAIILAK